LMGHHILPVIVLA